jgi:hypothetical protein
MAVTSDARRQYWHPKDQHPRPRRNEAMYNPMILERARDLEIKDTPLRHMVDKPAVSSRQLCQTVLAIFVM